LPFFPIPPLQCSTDPEWLAIVIKESTVAKRSIYTSMKGSVFELQHNLKLCQQSKACVTQCWRVSSKA
jgi:hypothetical protein